MRGARTFKKGTFECARTLSSRKAQLAASGAALLLVVDPCGPHGAPVSPILRWLRGLDRSDRLHIVVLRTRNRQLSLVLCLACVLADTHCEIRAHWLLCTASAHW